MMDFWEPLKVYFLSLKRPTRILIDFFKSDESLVVVAFLHNALLLFKKPYLFLQETSALFPQLTEIIESFKGKILERQNTSFFGAKTADLLRCIDDESAEVLKSSFQNFYTITLEYVDKWFHLKNHTTNTNWTLLRDQTVRYEEVVDLAKQLDPEMARMNELFDEVSAINILLKKIPINFFRKEKA